MEVWLGPVRRTLQNPGQTEATSPDNPAIGRRAQAKPARQPLPDTFWRRRSVNGTYARSPPPIRPLRGANAGFCGQVCSSLWQRRHTQPDYQSRRPVAIVEHRVVEQNSVGYPKKGLVMRSAKMIATLASVAAIACSILAFTWVGLALLGY